MLQKPIWNTKGPQIWNISIRAQTCPSNTNMYMFEADGDYFDWNSSTLFMGWFTLRGWGGVPGVEPSPCDLCFDPGCETYWFAHFQEVLEMAAMRKRRGIQGEDRRTGGRKTDRGTDRRTNRLTKGREQRQTKESTSERTIKKKKRERVGEKKKTTPGFRNNDFRAWAVAISTSLTELRAYQAYCITWGGARDVGGVEGEGEGGLGKGRNNQKCIRNNALFRLYPSLFRHPGSFTRSEWVQGGGPGAGSRSRSQRGGRVIKLRVAL